MMLKMIIKKKVKKKKKKKTCSKKGALKLLELLMSKKREKEEVDKMKEEIMIQTFQRARSTHSISNDSLDDSNNTKINNKRKKK